jgi:hypothetical protein
MTKTTPAVELSRALWPFDTHPLVAGAFAVGHCNAIDLKGRAYAVTCILRASGTHLVGVGRLAFSVPSWWAFPGPYEAVEFARQALWIMPRGKPRPMKKFHSIHGFS